MTGPLAFLVIAAIFVLALPRRFAIIPVLLAAAYTTRIPVLEIGPASFSVLRLLVVVGVLRAVVRREWVPYGLSTIDRAIFAWAALLIGMSAFHTLDAWNYRMGLVLRDVGVYVLCRILIQDSEDIRRVFKALCVASVPLALLMLVERHTGENLFAGMGGRSIAVVRAGELRACGPFAHPILAGTVGATFVPMALCLWRTHRASAVVGLCAAASIVYASNSTGPILMTLFACVGLLLWRFRNALSFIRWATITVIVLLAIVMDAPVYFLMARVDLTGSSAGWHRAQLIRSAMGHLGEWWLVGTDYTRHWMPSGIPANEMHTDITNHFLKMGVLGGLPLILLFCLIIHAGFRGVRLALNESVGQSPQRQFLIWTLGVLLFAHAINFWSISLLFDQASVFFFVILATIAAVQVRMPLLASDSVRVEIERASKEAPRWSRRAPAVDAGSGLRIQRKQDGWLQHRQWSTKASR